MVWIASVIQMNHLAMTKYLNSSVASLPQNDDKRKRGSILEIKSGFCETSNEDRT